MAITAPRVPPATTRGADSIGRTPLRVLVLAVVVAAEVIAVIVLAAPFFTEDWLVARIITWRESTADDYATRSRHVGSTNSVISPSRVMRPT